jgi:hypothetical protein
MSELSDRRMNLGKGRGYSPLAKNGNGVSS